MDLKVFLAVTLLLHAPIVLGCVNFRVILGAPAGLTFSLVDNGDQKCSLETVEPNYGANSYQLDCNIDYAAIFDPYGNGGTGKVTYNPPSGIYNFPTTTPVGGPLGNPLWTADWGC